MPNIGFAEMFRIDTLSIIMVNLVSFIGIIVYFFSRRYMKGDALYRHFFRDLLILLVSVILMSIADNLLLFLSAWCCCNWTLTKLMIHKSAWKAAKASGKLALQNFVLGFCTISIAFALLYTTTGSLSIHTIVNNPDHSWNTIIALMLILMGAMTQSAIWPFHRWLTSSLNSPTPVSAIMHAGIVNGGGFILARFAPLYFSTPNGLNIIFIVGMISALLGSLWKLMQHDIKRMLACSTMGQMGFMLVQCGLGLFTSALAHLCWHGIFKAYLFLASGNAAKDKKIDLGPPPSVICLLNSLVCAALGSSIFVIINQEYYLSLNSTLVIAGIVFIVGSQLAITMLGSEPFKRLPLAILITAIMGAFYGINVYLFDLILSPLNLMQPQPLNLFHVSALLILVLAWVFILFLRYSDNRTKYPHWILSLYVKALNNSQPHPTTITTHRKGYNYV